MNPNLYPISVLNLLLAFIPIAIVAFFYMRWSLNAGTVIYAALRMITQLVLVGLVLSFVFNQENIAMVLLILSTMLLLASWIALRPVKELRKTHYFKALLAIAIAGIPILTLTVAGIIQFTPWHEPRYLIPLAGMIFANAMNGMSLAAERFHSETQKGMSYSEARGVAFQTALLPTLNTFFAVGIVALPGMMTGQVLAGISPMMAIRYQIMIMSMIFGASGIASAIYLCLAKEREA